MKAYFISAPQSLGFAGALINTSGIIFIQNGFAHANNKVGGALNLSYVNDYCMIILLVISVYIDNLIMMKASKIYYS